MLGNNLFIIIILLQALGNNMIRLKQKFNILFNIDDHKYDFQKYLKYSFVISIHIIGTFSSYYDPRNI